MNDLTKRAIISYNKSMKKRATYYHGSPIANLRTLKPAISNHKKPLVYLSSKRENCLPYLANAIEQFALEQGIKCDHYQKWASYGFNKEGKLVIQEYYPDALRELYEGVSGYIYRAESVELEALKDIPDAYVSAQELNIIDYEYIEDAYREIKKLAQEGKLKICRYDDIDKEYLENMIRKEFSESEEGLYKSFLKAKFSFLKEV